MYYNLIKTPALIKTGNGVFSNLDDILRSAHLYYPSKILVTQQNLIEQYKHSLKKEDFDDILLLKGGVLSESEALINQIKNTDALIIAFGGGSILDLVKYSATKCDLTYITVPSTLSNDAIYSCVARLSENGKKRSLGVQPPIGIIVDLEIIKNSPKELLLAGVGDLITNLSAIQDWKLSFKNTHEPINELAYILAKNAAVPLLEYNENDLYKDDFLLDLANGLIMSGLSMIVSGNTRGTSGAEHLISHAIDEYFQERASIHGLQAAWAFLLIEKNIRKNEGFEKRLREFYTHIGLIEVINQRIKFSEDEFLTLIPYAKKIRKRYTIFNTIKS